MLIHLAIFLLGFLAFSFNEYITDTIFCRCLERSQGTCNFTSTPNPLPCYDTKRHSYPKILKNSRIQKDLKLNVVSVLALLLTLGAASAKYCPGSRMLRHCKFIRRFFFSRRMICDLCMFANYKIDKGDYTCHKTCIKCDQEAWFGHQRRVLVPRECNFILSGKQNC